ncbi:MAG TPA: glycoside hydrolase family 3 N-terminal domain-containing protein [Pyrinomonadaceae bacterium]|nr:glycoside hydrolase family 3 N-terminal domain-containing protein [Pyrinomonadaceae bacterium]
MPSLTIEQKIGQLFFIGIPGPEINDHTRDLLERVEPGGVCLFSRNVRERAQTRELLNSLREMSAVQLFLSVDQEGGLVDRLRRIVTPMPPPNRIRDPRDAAEFGRIVADTLRVLGFNMNFAPVVDVVDPDRERFSNGLHSRAFGRSKEQAAEFAAAFLTSMQTAGCLGCVKHFPGLGASEVDSHKELPSVSVSEDELSGTDLFPYKKLLASGEVHAVMVAHAAFPSIGLQEEDQNGKLLPSSLSPAIISNLLRGELEYDGLVLTDDLEMGAIVENYGIGEACKMAVHAGADMLAICAGVDAIYEGHTAILKAVNEKEISEERIDQSIARIFSAKSRLELPLPFDNDRLDSLSDEIAAFAARLK